MATMAPTPGVVISRRQMRLLAVLRDLTVDPARRDEMAKAAAPYIHPRLAAIEAQVAITGHEAALDELE